MNEKATTISERSMIKLPAPLAITICLSLIAFGGIYYKTTSAADAVIDLEEVVTENEDLDRQEREAIEDESERDDEKMEARIMDFMKAEIDGLRADWDRDRVDQNRRLERLEDSHWN